MKLSDLGGQSKQRLIKGIIRSRKKIYFRSWADEVRKLIPPSEKNSEHLWRQFIEQSKDVWEAHKDILFDLSVDALQAIATKEQKAAKECGVVINMKDHKKEMGHER